MRRRSAGITAAAVVAIAVPLALLVPNAQAKSLAGKDDKTKPYGPFGFTTLGLGTEGNYGEPSLAIAPDGKHVVASTPGCAGVCYWYSADRGKTWKTSESSGGGGDSELEFLKDGTLLSADLAIENSVMHRSFDFGKTWKDSTTAGTEQDRQWLAHQPNAKKTGGTTYLVYHDFVLEAEFIAVSENGGKTWTTNPQDQILVNSAAQFAATPAGVGCNAGNTSSLVDQGVNTFSGPMMVDPNGKDLYVIYSISDLQSNIDPTAGVPPFGPTRAVVVGHSGDKGQTWTNRYVVCADLAGPPSQETVNGAIFPWGFIDPAGTVYVVFNSTRGQEGTQHFHQYYVYSKDKGATWSPPVRLDKALKPGEGASIYATGAAVKPGVIDVAWYQTDNGTPADDNSTWVPHFAQVKKADTKSPKIVEQAVTTIPNHKGGICLQGILCGVAPGSGDRSLLDFFELAVNPKTGLAGIAYADNNRLGDEGEVVYAAQTRGQPKATKPGSNNGGNNNGGNNAGNNSGGNNANNSGGNLATTGFPPLVGLAALALLATALFIRRRIRHST